MLSTKVMLTQLSSLLVMLQMLDCQKIEWKCPKYLPKTPEQFQDMIDTELQPILTNGLTDELTKQFVEKATDFLCCYTIKNDEKHEFIEPEAIRAYFCEQRKNGGDIEEEKMHKLLEYSNNNVVPLEQNVRKLAQSNALNQQSKETMAQITERVLSGSTAFRKLFADATITDDFSDAHGDGKAAKLVTTTTTNQRRNRSSKRSKRSKIFSSNHNSKQTCVLLSVIALLLLCLVSLFGGFLGKDVHGRQGSVAYVAQLFDPAVDASGPCQPPGIPNPLLANQSYAVITKTMHGYLRGEELAYFGLLMTFFAYFTVALFAVIYKCFRMGGH